MKLLLLLVFSPLVASHNRDFDKEAIAEIEREREVTRHIVTERLHIVNRQIDFLRSRLKVTDYPFDMMEESEKVHGDKMAILSLLNRMKK